MRLFYRNCVYYTRYLNAVFQLPSIYDWRAQEGPRGLGWTHFMIEDRPLGICVITEMP